MFKDVKVGDRVWELRRGWGKVEGVESGTWPINVLFEEPDADGDEVWESFTPEGKAYPADMNPTLFWDEVKFEIPEKPVQLVDRTFEGWVNVYSYQEAYYHPDKETADKRDSGRVGCYKVTVALHDVPEGKLGGLREIS